MRTSLEQLLNFDKLNSAVVKKVIEELEAIDCKWRDVGDIELNTARMNIVADPDSTIVERITNGMDAIVDRKILSDSDIAKVESPREAAAKILGIKDGYLCNLTDEESRSLVKERSDIEVFVKINDGVNLFFRDYGIGLTNREMPGTILSLNESNKFRKPYLIGQYGQGGSTTCVFSDYTVIITRKAVADNDHVAFTIVRFNPLGEDAEAKDGKYEYLVQGNPAPNNIPLYVSPNEVDFPYGTLVIHIKYQTSINEGFINYYKLLDNYLFDPPLPYSLYYEKWETGSRRNLFGGRRRLTTNPLCQNQYEYAHTIVGHPEYGEVKIRYWLLKPFEEKEKNGKQAKEAVRTDTFLHDEKFPILVTYNGQVQGKLSRTLFKDDCKFGYIYKSLIAQIECDGLTPFGKKFFFTSGRDRLKVPAEKEVEAALITLFSQDEYLKNENQQREENSLSEKIGKDTTEIRKKLAEMINKLNPGRFKINLSGVQKSGGGSGTQSQHAHKVIEPLLPLSTKSEPTFINIVNEQDPIPIRKGRTCKIRIESDAPDDLFKIGGWAIDLKEGITPDLLVHSRTDFNGGRINLFVECDENAVIGKIFDAQLTLKSVDGKIIDSNIRKIEVKETPQAEKSNQLEINAPEIIPLTDTDQQYTEFNWNEETVADVKEGARRLFMST